MGDGGLGIEAEKIQWKGATVQKCTGGYIGAR